MVEIIVALLILGVLLSAAAGSLISFSRATVVNEYRVQATAYQTFLHEELQSIPWDQVVLYEDETAALDGAGLLDADGESLNGEALVTIEGPLDPACRVVEFDADNEDLDTCLRVPLAAYDVIVDDRSFEVFQMVTDTGTRVVDDAVTDGVVPLDTIRRFTTRIEWRVLGRDYVETFESLRAPTPGERETIELPDLRLFLFAPSQVPLIEVEIPPAIEGDPPTIELRNATDIDIFARFQPGETGVAVELPVESCDHDDVSLLVDGRFPLEEVTDYLSDDVAARAWRVTIPAEACVFDTTLLDVVDGSGEVRVFGNVFAAAEGSAFPITTTTRAEGDPVDIPLVGALPTLASGGAPILVGTRDGLEDRLCQDVTLDGTVAGAPADTTMTAYFAGTTAQSRSMAEQVPGTFRLTLAAGSESPWIVPRGTRFRDQFFLIAKDDITSQDSLLETTAIVDVNKPITGVCPP